MVFRTTKRVGVTMRDLGDITAYLRRGMREILCLALFFFTFLACEYFFDARMAEFVPSSEVVIYESIVVGASVIGFFVRPFLYYRRPQTIDATSDITGVLLVSALLLMIMAVRFEVVIAGGLVACCALGYCGSTAHANLARRFAQTPCLARAVAVSYAAGILVQVLNHMVMPAGIPQQSVLIACAIALVGCFTVPAALNCVMSLRPSSRSGLPSYRSMRWSVAPDGTMTPRQRRPFRAPWCV